MVANKRNAPHPRRKSIKKSMKSNISIIALLKKENENGDPLWFTIFFYMFLFTFLTAGMNFYIPLYFLGVL